MTPRRARLAVAVAFAAAAWALTRWARRHLRVVTVSGTSMLPAYRPGDLLTIRRIPASAIRPGDVVILHADSPGRHQPVTAPWIIKRVAAVPGDPVAPGTLPYGHQATVPPGQLILLGDNLAHSIDSRQHGYFPASNVIGRVITGAGRRTVACYLPRRPGPRRACRGWRAASSRLRPGRRTVPGSAPAAPAHRPTAPRTPQGR